MPPKPSDGPNQGTMTDAVSGRLEQARALHQQGQLAPAREIYQEILDRQPGHFDALNLMGVVSGQLRDLSVAVQCFDRAIAVQPDNSRPYCNRGLALKELGLLDAALSSFDQAIALKDDDAVAWYSRANICRELG